MSKEAKERQIEALESFIDTLPGDVYRHWVMRMFWGWFTSEESVGLSREDHDMMCCVVKELMRLFDSMAESEREK